jgi:hypothetical protein
LEDGEEESKKKNNKKNERNISNVKANLTPQGNRNRILE